VSTTTYNLRGNALLESSTISWAGSWGPASGLGGRAFEIEAFAPDFPFTGAPPI